MTGRRIRRGLAALAVVGIVAGGYAAYAAEGGEASYRTAVAKVGDVEQTLALAGTVEPSGRADLQFGTSGTVASVQVAEGDSVKAGQVLARLDRTSLSTAVTKARAQLTSAQAQLESDEDAQADAVSSASDTSSSQSTPTSEPSESSESSEPSEQVSEASEPDDAAEPDPALVALAQQQQAVTTAQSAASAAITDAKTALTAQTAACAEAYAAPAADPTADPSATPTETADPADAACATALTTVQTAQDAVATAQDGLQAAINELAGTLTKAITALGHTDDQSEQPSTPTTESTQTPTVEPSDASSDDSSSSERPSTQGSGQTVTAATLARDQASIDQARAELVAAKQALSAATVRAPHAGRVASVSAVAGAGVSAGDAAVTVIALGTTTVELAVTDTQVRQLEVGQAADVTPAGAGSSLAGKVTAIGAVPDTSTGSTTYTVMVTLDERDLALASGATASVAVVVGTAKDVVTVPASAVKSGSVTVLDGDDATRTRVTTGVVGTSRIEVTDGLTAGEEVVIADLSAAVPTGDSTTNERGGGFGPTLGGPGARIGGPRTSTR